MARLDEIGCEYGRMLDLRVKTMNKKLDEILENQKILFNHQSSWSRPEAVQEMKRQNKLITILVAVLCAGIGAGVTLIGLLM